MSDLPDAPWIVESWYTGPDPDCCESPYDNSTDATFLEGADCEYGWRILAWVINADEDECDDDALQSLWGSLTQKAREGYCKAFQISHRDDAEDMYNDYWKEWRQ